MEKITVKAVLFDLDGTLLYTLPDIHNCINLVLKDHGYPQRCIPEVRSFVGGGLRKLVEMSAPAGAADLDAMCEEYGTLYSAHAEDNIEFYPGIKEIVAELRSRGIKTGVSTNKPHCTAEAMINRFFGDTMDVTEGKRDNRPAKPSPENVNDAMARMGSKAETTLYVGDSPTDALSAQNAGLPCLLVSWGYSDKSELEKYPALGIIDKPEQLFDYINL